MTKRFTLYLLSLSLASLSYMGNGLAQCTVGTSGGGLPAYNGSFQNQGSVGPGVFYTLNMTAGRIYTFRTTGGGNWGNPYLTLTNSGNGVLAFNDNNGPYYTDNCSGGENFASFDWVPTTNYSAARIHVTRDGCAGWFSGNNSAILEYRECIPPAVVFGNNTWRVYAFNGTDRSLTSSQAAYGYYENSTVNINSAAQWTNTPSEAPGWVGCVVPVDNHTVVYKRQGFPCGYYQIDVNNHDDDARLYINGAQVWDQTGCCADRGIVWSGELTSGSTVEFRVQEGCGGTLLNADLNRISSPVASVSGTTTVCQGAASPNITFGNPQSMAITVTYNINGGGNQTIHVPASGSAAVAAPTGSAGTFNYNLVSVVYQAAPNCPNAVSGTATVSVTAPVGNPSVFGSNTWNVYVYNGRNRDNLGAITYYGYYTQAAAGPNYGFNTQALWGTNSSPSTAPGYQGCSVPVDNHTFVHKRQGFPCGVYRLSFQNWDDETILYVNGVQRWENGLWDGGCNPCDSLAGNFYLDAGSTIEVRTAEGGGGSNCQLDIVAVTPTAVGGTVTGGESVCSGGNPAAFGSSLGASSSDVGASLTYQWQSSTTDCSTGFSNISGAISATYDPSNVLVTTHYRRNAVDQCGTAVATTNCLTVTTPPASTVLAGSTQTATCPVAENNYIHLRDPATGNLICSINSNGQNLGNVTATVYDDGAPIPIQACGTYQPWYVTSTLQRHWVIQPQAQPSGSVSIRLPFDDGELSALIASSNANSNPNDNVNDINWLDLSKYNNTDNPALEDGSFGNNCASGATSSVYSQTGNGSVSSMLSGFNANAYYVQYSIPGFSEFWLSGTDNVSPLPIELLSFYASCHDGKVKLEWTTASEINNEKFIIHRSSDLMGWEEVMTLPGAGNSNTLLSYISTDDRPLQGLSYYRLTQIDYDGVSETFKPISVVCYSDHEGNAIMVYPNPATDAYVVAVLAADDMPDVYVELIDMNGKVISSRKENLVKGNNLFNYTVDGIDPGTYLVRIRSGALGIKPIKLIIGQN